MKHAMGFLELVEDALTRVREVSVEEVRARQLSPLSFGRGGGVSRGEGPHPARDASHPLPEGEGFILIDVREDGEWAAGHIEGAVHMGKGVIERDIECTVPDKDVPLVLYCGGGYRSAIAADSLQKMGYKNVYSMAGGWRAWCESGFPRE